MGLGFSLTRGKLREYNLDPIHAGRLDPDQLTMKILGILEQG